MIWKTFSVDDLPRTLGVIISIILLIWVVLALPLTIYHQFNPQTSGTFGDTFGIVNSLFSALAFGALYYTILLQKKELNDTRKEFKEQKEALQIQRFETTFFNLINLYQAQSEKLSNYDNEAFQLLGKNAFVPTIFRLENVIGEFEFDGSQENFADLCKKYQKFFFHERLGNFKVYLSIFNSILTLINISKLTRDQVSFYSSLVAANLTEEERTFLYYHVSLTDVKGDYTAHKIILNENKSQFFKKLDIATFHDSHSELYEFWDVKYDYF
jgi:hypothetical protein